MTPEREARIRRTLGDFIALLGRGDEADPMTCAADLLAALDEARRERDDAMVRHAREQDEASAQRAALVADRDGWKDIAERRYALRSELEATLGIPHGPAESDSVEKAHARLRAILDERDSASAEAQALRAQWQSSLVSLRTGTLERERDAALAREARLREAAGAVLLYGSDEGLTTRDYHPIEPDSGPFATLRRILAASTAEHGERVLREAEERGRAAVLADERTAMELGEALAARMAELKFGPRTIEQWTGVAADALAVCRAARKEGTR